MKKRIKPWKCKVILFSLFFGLLLPLVCCTDIAQAERSFSMQRIVVDAEVLPDASMKVTERLTIKFSGQWNGFNVKILEGDTPIREVAVYEAGQPYKFNPGKDYGPPGTYLIKSEGGKKLIDWSISARDETRTFDVSYRVINAVKLHNDVAELYRKFIGADNQHKVEEVKVNLRLPPKAHDYKQGEEIRIWGHGPLNGEVNFISADTVCWQVRGLSPYTFVEGRVVMPLALFTEAPAQTYTGKTALAGILAEENGWAKDANRQRAMARAEYAGAFAIIAGAAGVVLLLWRKYGRRYAAQFEGEYYRDLPANYSPAELSVLWNYNKIQAHDLTATILDLARRKFLWLEEDTVQVSRLFGNKEISTYRLSFLPRPEPAALRKPEEAQLRDHERDLLDYLQNSIGGGQGYIYLTDIEQYAKKYGQDFFSFWKRWTAGLEAKGEQLNFFDHSGNMPLATILGGLVLFTAGAALVSKAPTWGFALIIAGAIIGVVPRLFKRRSVSGQEDFVRWRAFKRFLLHFSEMERHEIPSLIIWEHYLVYAVTLGVAREVMKQLELVFPKMQDGDYHFGYGWLTYGNVTGFTSLPDSLNGIGAAMERSLNSAQSAVSKASSGSGGGGGFSGGGGGGGGGSSYGGR